ncbi:fibronectin type III domain-containing protein [Myxococcus sp. RHSTA-1-4]|uniref:fibronectin type III domain-containing protein n=1 Tax=Myxococcus sp. RHSTA-1-4 TaxID=2874601 RepID=UPI001CBADFDB|nr:fibronectin type III domain-containing protein [Myxococcus sp. RHSTA-1-4]MBZ4416824.1 fibronectin type III domain-containing protein [Myxococcus sp. RHSTA-1-4]
MVALFATVSLLACSSEPEVDTDAGTPPPDDSGTSEETDSGTEPVGEGIRFNPTVHIIDERGQGAVMQTGAWTDAPSPAALVPGGLPDGGVRVYPARHVGVEGYVVPGVPEGEYLLRFNDTLLVTDARQVELRSTMVQRPSLEWSVPTGTALDLRVSGLAPWRSSDILRLSSPNGSTPMEDLRLSTAEHFGGTLPTAGATGLDVRVSRFLSLLDGSKGDSLWVQQLSESAGIDGGHSFTRVVRSFHQPAVPLTPGTATSLDVALTGGTERTVSFSVDGAAFAAQLEATHPDAQGLGSLNWAIGARPGAEAFARLGSHPELAFASTSIDVPLAPYTVSFLDAFPEHWRRVAHVSSSTRVRLTSGGAAYQRTLVLQRADTLEGLVEAGTLAPRLGPVRNLRINGQDATAARSGVGTTPLVSWDPPELGTATRYFVRVTPLLQQGAGFTAGTSRTLLVTSKTEVRLPPGLVSGSHFVVTVTATRGAGTRSPHEGELPLDMAEATTGILSP